MSKVFLVCFLIALAIAGTIGGIVFGQSVERNRQAKLKALEPDLTIFVKNTTLRVNQLAANDRTFTVWDVRPYADGRAIMLVDSQGHEGEIFVPQERFDAALKTVFGKGSVLRFRPKDTPPKATTSNYTTLCVLDFLDVEVVHRGATEPVPEPTTLVVLGAGTLWFWRRRRTHS